MASPTRALFFVLSCLLLGTFVFSQQASDTGKRFDEVRAQFAALADKSDQDGIRALGRKLLDEERSARILVEAANWDKADRIALFERAIAQRMVPQSAAGARLAFEPAVEDIRWAYAAALLEAGHADGAAREWIAVLDEQSARMDSLPANMTRLRENIAARYDDFGKRCGDTRLRDAALEYLALEQPSNGGSRLDARNLKARALVYEKLGKADTALDYLARSYAEQMSRPTRDTMLAVAKANGKNADELLERAADIRLKKAAPAYNFDLEKDTGGHLKLADIKSRAVLLAFFFPT